MLPLQEIKLAITKIVVLNTIGTDRVYVHTDLPSPYPLEVSDQPLMLAFDTQKGKGVEYVRANFNMEPEVIDTYVPYKVT